MCSDSWRFHPQCVFADIMDCKVSALTLLCALFTLLFMLKGFRVCRLCQFVKVLKSRWTPCGAEVSPSPREQPEMLPLGLEFLIGPDEDVSSSVILLVCNSVLLNLPKH